MATDFISREAVIGKITDLINKSGKYTAYESGADDACYIVEHEIPAADVVEKTEWDKLMFLVEAANNVLKSAPKWISVKERLPEPGERVLYCYRGFVGEGYVTRSGEWERAGIWTRYYPSHWMPLPEPPKEGGGEDG